MHSTVTEGKGTILIRHEVCQEQLCELYLIGYQSLFEGFHEDQLQIHYCSLMIVHDPGITSYDEIFNTFCCLHCPQMTYSTHKEVRYTMVYYTLICKQIQFKQ